MPVSFAFFCPHLLAFPGCQLLQDPVWNKCSKKESQGPHHHIVLWVTISLGLCISFSWQPNSVPCVSDWSWIGVSCPSPMNANFCLVSIKHLGFKPVSNLCPGSRDSLLLPLFRKYWIFVCVLGRCVLITPYLLKDSALCFFSLPRSNGILPDTWWQECLLHFSQLKAFMC